MKKLFYPILILIFTLMLLFILLITSFEAVCYRDMDYYGREFEKYQVLSEMKQWIGDDMKEDALEEVMKQTLRYLRGDRENLIIYTEINGTEQEFYNENEKSHMADVKLLFVRSLTLRALAIMSCIAIMAFLIIMENGRAFRLLGIGYLKVCAGILTALLCVGLLAASDFTKYFTIFHEIFFSQGNWMFDPRESRMINMLPEGFFSDTALRILLLYIGSIAAIALPCLLLFKRSKRSR